MDSTPKKLPRVVRWRQIVFGPDGPDPKLRELLLFMNLEMDAAGHTRITEQQIATYWGKSDLRGIRRLLSRAVEAGWLSRKKLGNTNRAGYQYKATVPEDVLHRPLAAPNEVDYLRVA